MIELVLTVVLLLAAFAVRRASVHRETRWRGGLFFDARARTLLRARTREARRRFARASDALFYVLVLYPGLVDGFVVAGLVAGDYARAGQIFLVDLEGFTATSLVMFSLQRYVSRERPYATFPDEGAYAPVYPERFRSFFSGHAAAGCTGATLVALHHARIPGFDTTWHLAVTILLVLMAVATALFRVVSDRHWLTDVVAGAILGVISGWLVPVMLHGWAGRLLESAG